VLSPETGVFTTPAETRISSATPTLWYRPGSFRATYPGEAGQRNNFRGPGYFGIDTGIGKTWKPKESQELRFSWEVFNVTNSVRFDAAEAVANESLVSLSTFGKYIQTLTSPRVMQFGSGIAS